MKIYPVVHIIEPKFAVEQAELALEAGADGVYLIDHLTAESDKAFETFNLLHGSNDGKFKDSYVGLNLLGLNSHEAVEDIEGALLDGSLVRAPNGLWVDNVLSSHNPQNTLKKIHETPALQTMRLLGGIAFKYTSQYTDDPFKAAEQVSKYRHLTDVVTTSGRGTGHAPSVEKIMSMKQQASVAIGTQSPQPLAVASSIDAKNMPLYEGYIDEVLIASSIETESYSGEFDKAKLVRAIEVAHALD